MIDYKKTKAPQTTITRDMNELTEKVGNVYETIAIIGKRSNQISTSMKKELDAKLHDWLEALDAHGLSNRESVFCVYLLIYPDASMEQLADWMNYSAKGISTFKRRVALKLGVQTKDLHDYLHNKLYKLADK